MPESGPPARWHRPEGALSPLSPSVPPDQIGRYRDLAHSGVHEAIVSLADVGASGSVRDFAPIIDAFAR